MHAIPEHLRGVITTRHYTNPRLPLPLHYSKQPSYTLSAVGFNWNWKSACKWKEWDGSEIHAKVKSGRNVVMLYSFNAKG